MLPGGTDGLYRAALAAGHRVFVMVEVLDGAGNVLPLPAEFTSEETGGLLIGGGSVEATLASRVTRRATVTLPQGMYPALPPDLIAPYGNRLRITRGVEFADGGRYAWVVFTGRIQRPQLSPDGIVTVPAADRAYEVAEFGFAVPEDSQVGDLVDSEVRRLISDALDDAVFTGFDTFSETVPLLNWESDRAAALDEMSTSVGAFWYALADGSFTLRRYPWTVAGSPVVTIADGVDGIAAGSPLRDREDVWNSITVTGERADGSLPVYAVAEDNNPDSPTYVDGTFGRRHKTINLRTPQTQGTAQSAANAWLRRSIALQETWSWLQPPDASLELGDVVQVDMYGRTGVIQVVSGFSLPLDTGSMMTVQAHAQVIGALE